MAQTNVGVKPVIVVHAGDGPGVVVNRDEVNLAFWGTDDSILGGNPTSASILDPLVGIPVSGDTDIYCCTSTASMSVNIDFIPAAYNWGPSPAQIATQIALKGITVNFQGLAIVNPSGDTTGVADTANILQALGVIPGPKVTLGPGDFYITSNALNGLKSFTDFGGSGFCTRIHLVNNDANQFGVMIGNLDKENCLTIEMFVLDGNKSNQIANAWQTGLWLSNSAAGPFFTDGRHKVSFVFLENGTGTALVQTGRGGSTFNGVQIFTWNAFGMNIHEDCYYNNVSVGACGLDGILEQGASNQFTGCKSWFSGAALISSRIAGATLTPVTPPAGIPSYDGGGIAGLVFSLANGYGNGHLVRNISGAAVANSGSGGTATGVYYQDNARAGYCNIDGSQNRVVRGVFERNNNCGTNGGVPNGGFAGVDLNSSNCDIGGESMMTSGNVNQQAAAINLGPSANDCRIDLGFKGTLNDGSNMPPLTAGSNPVKCALNFKAANGASYFNPGFAASFTPDPFRSEVIEVGALTANITINPPQLTGGTGNVTGYNSPFFTYPGMRFKLILTEDATGGRTVTFGAGINNAHAANTAAFNTNVWEFLAIGNNTWIETSYANP